MTVKELKDLLNNYSDETIVGIHSYYEYGGGEKLELADGVSEGFTDEGDKPVLYIY